MKWALCGFAIMLVAAGCSRNIDTPEAVRRGVINDLSKRMDVQNMDVSVDSVSFRDREADALVSFAPKGAGRGQGMTMRYKMRRDGDQWRIAGRSSGDLQRHAQPQTGAANQAAEPFPAGHPPLANEGAATGNLPPGHPAIPSGATR